MFEELNNEMKSDCLINKALGDQVVTVRLKRVSARMWPILSSSG